jgi:hypothetical protein
MGAATTKSNLPAYDSNWQVVLGCPGEFEQQARTVPYRWNSDARDFWT